MSIFDLCNKVPPDILLYRIKPYIISKCDKCCREECSDDFNTHIYMKKYKSAFDNDFYLWQVKSDCTFYKILCNRCQFTLLKNDYFPIKKFHEFIS
jgi:hypothetical protein